MESCDGSLPINCCRFADPERPTEEGLYVVPDHYRERLAGFVDNFLNEPFERPLQSLAGTPMITTISIIQGPMTGKYVIGQENVELGQILYLHLARFYSDPTGVLARGDSCSPARHAQNCGCVTNEVYNCFALMLVDQII